MTDEIRHVFFDIGGVLATNGWDREQRKLAMEKFNLDPEAFQYRHEEMVGSLEEGTITLDEYLRFTVFNQPRDFSKEEFVAFVQAQSKPFPDSIEIARAVAEGCRYWVMTLNNESDQLNRFRIKTFGLNEIFDAFLTSCWLRARKPTLTFYERAFSIAQSRPEQSVFIDDREQNLAPAHDLGVHVIHYQSAPQLASELRKLGIKFNYQES
jgi:putative hydrolase of the HAD superfamily